MTRHSQHFRCTCSNFLVVLLVLEQSCLPMYQTLGTFSFYILSEHQPSKFRQVPKMSQKLFLTQGKFYCPVTLPSVIFAFIMPVFMICRYKITSLDCIFPQFIYFFCLFSFVKEITSGPWSLFRKKNTCNSLLRVYFLYINFTFRPN